MVLPVLIVVIVPLVPQCPSAPGAPPAEVCGNANDLKGPAAPPAGALTVPAGNNASLTLNRPNTVYWFAPGTHTLGTSNFSQIIPVSR